MSKTVAITGGLGCIGLAVGELLLERGYNVTLVDLPERYQQIRNVLPESIAARAKLSFGSILDAEFLVSQFIGCDAVIHLAAYLGVGRTEANPLRCLELNVIGSKKVFEAASMIGVDCVVNASSSEVYGEPLSDRVSETAVTQGKTVYAISKLAAEEYLRGMVCKRIGIERAVSLRFFNTFGPFQIAQFVVPRFIEAVQLGKSPIVYGDGSQIRSYCYSVDTAEGIILALERSKEDYDFFNIGNPANAICLKDLGDLVCDISQSNCRPVVLNSFESTDRIPSREINRRLCDITKAQNLLGFNPRTSVEDGIGRVLQSKSLHPEWSSQY